MFVSLTSFDQESGSDLPMMSRSGKETIPRYLAFRDKNKHAHTESTISNLIGGVKRKDKEERDASEIDSDTAADLGIDSKDSGRRERKRKMNETKSINFIQEEMKKIDSLYKPKKDAFKGVIKEAIPEMILASMKECKPESQSAAFRATNRDKANLISKLRPERDNRNYNCKFTLLKPKVNEPVIRKEHSSDVIYRKKQRDYDKGSICLKAIKQCNYSVQNTKSGWKVLARSNLLLNGTGTPRDDEELDKVNFHIKEMKEPLYRPVTEQDRAKTADNFYFDRTYLPNGAQVIRQKYEDQKPAINKFYYHDLHRPNYGYKMAFQGE